MTTSHRAIDVRLPLKPVVFHILLALAEEPAHGYGVIQAVRDGTDGRLRLETGGFYRHLRKLLDGGMVVESEDRPDGVDPRRGAYYRLTPTGRDVLAAESRRLSAVVATTRSLGLLDGEPVA